MSESPRIPTLSSTQSLELAVCRLHPEAVENYPALHRELMETVQRMPGFRSALSLRGVAERTLVADYVVWESLEAAHAAADALRATPVFPRFGEAMAQLVLFDHQRLLSRTPAAAVPGALFELAVYSLKDGAAQPFLAAHPGLLAQAARCEGFAEAQSSRSVASPARFTDLLRWRSHGEALHAAEAVHASEACAAAMAHLERQELFVHLEVLSVTAARRAA